MGEMEVRLSYEAVELSTAFGRYVPPCRYEDTDAGSVHEPTRQ